MKFAIGLLARTILLFASFYFADWKGFNWCMAAMLLDNMFLSEP